MRPLAEDTPIEIEHIQMELLSRLSPAQKMERMVSLNRSLRSMVRAQIRQRYPDASEREIDLRTASRWLDPEMMAKAFGWDPRVEGY
jgi:hypothetical protein